MHSTLAPHWLSDPAWLAMDATARGFHAQLLLIASRRKPAGTLPDNDAMWRKWLGLPATAAQAKQTNLSKSWVKACSQQGLPAILVGAMQQLAEAAQAEIPKGELDPNALVDWLWIQRWKPMVLSGWERIDQAMASSDPRLQSSLGEWHSPIALAISVGTGLHQQSIIPKPAEKPRTRRGKKDPPPSPWEHRLDGNGDAANEGLPQLSMANTNLHDPKEILARWRPEVDTQSRKSMWEMGVVCLVGEVASDAEKSKARAILGKHIKQYGEEAVAKAVGQMAVRSVSPADAVSFLMGMLRQAEEGSPAQQAARQKRANLNL